MARRVSVCLSPALVLALVAYFLVGQAAGAGGLRPARAHVGRARHQHQTAKQALGTLRKAFPAQVASGFTSFNGSHLVRRLSDHQAIVATSTGRYSLAVGVLPLFGRTPAGRTAPVDLRLVRRGSTFVPRSALMRVSLPSSTGGAVTFATPRMAIRFAAGPRVAGRQAGGAVFFANIGGRAHHTDAVVRPTPAGAMVSFVLRSPASLGSKHLTFALPKGSRLRSSASVSGAVQILSGRRASVAFVAPLTARDAHGRAVPAHYRVRGKQLVITLSHRHGFAYPILVGVPVTDLALGAWSGAHVAWRAVTGKGKPALTHSAYGDYGVWSGAGHRRYTANSMGEYLGSAPVGAYIYKLVETGVIHTLGNSQVFGGIAKAGGAGWETAGAWRGPDGKGTGAHYSTRGALSDAMYTYCAIRSCAPGAAVDTGNAAVFGLSMLGANRGSTPTAGLINDAILYEADKGPVVIGVPRHRGYRPGTWVNNGVDTVTASAAQTRGLGIASLRLSAAGLKGAPSANPRCAGSRLSTCPRSYTGSIGYSTANMPDGRDTVSERAISAGGTLSRALAWTVDVDHKRPSIKLTGALAAKNNASVGPGSYGLSISARDTNGSTPTSGIARIAVLVDGKAQSGVSGFSPCSFGAQCASSAAASWTFAASQFAAGKHTITVESLDSAGNVTTSSLSVSVQSTPPNLYWGASVGTQFTGNYPPFDWNAETDFANLDSGGKQPSIVSWGQPWSASAYCTSSSPYPAGHYCPFQTSLFDSVRQRGYVPMLSWASGNAGNYWDPNFMDGAIADGSQDAYIAQWARDAKAWGHPLFLRFDWEMNGSWFNYGTGKHPTTRTANNTPAQFVAMWRHVHDIFTSVGAANVTWLWCTNIDFGLGSPVASNYPGNAYADWTCIDAYNANDPWQSFNSLIGSTYPQVMNFAPNKPMLIGETGSTATGGSKSQWISGMFRDLAGSFPNVQGLVWEDVDAPGPGGQTDWPIEGPDKNNPDTASTSAFASGVKSPRYKTNTYSQLNTSPIPPPS